MIQSRLIDIDTDLCRSKKWDDMDALTQHHWHILGWGNGYSNWPYGFRIDNLGSKSTTWVLPESVSWHVWHGYAFFHRLFLLCTCR